jgi:hypothetical protein
LRDSVTRRYPAVTSTPLGKLMLYQLSYVRARTILAAPW